MKYVCLSSIYLLRTLCVSDACQGSFEKTELVWLTAFRGEWSVKKYAHVSINDKGWCWTEEGGGHINRIASSWVVKDLSENLHFYPRLERRREHLLESYRKPCVRPCLVSAHQTHHSVQPCWEGQGCQEKGHRWIYLNHQIYSFFCNFKICSKHEDVII